MADPGLFQTIPDIPPLLAQGDGEQTAAAESAIERIGRSGSCLADQ